VRQLEHKMRVREVYTDMDMVFARLDGTPTHANVLARNFEKLTKEAGVPRIRIHDLRHTFATLALTGDDVSEADLKVISESMGHADVSTTLRTYAHVVPVRPCGSGPAHGPGQLNRGGPVRTLSTSQVNSPSYMCITSRPPSRSVQRAYR